MKTKKQRLKEKCVAKITKKVLEENKKCELCGAEAITCHHFIHQARSNYLRCDKKNLIPVCASCHYKFHQGGYAELFSGILIKKRGMAWFNYLEKNIGKMIKDTVFYWDNLEKNL